jgi:hypothetical protein
VKLTASKDPARQSSGNPPPADKLEFVTAVSRADVLARYLCGSPCLKSGRRHLVAHFNAPSAADAFNPAMNSIAADASSTWLVWVHQDVLLPGDWDERFLEALRAAQKTMPALAVAGVYGMAAGTRPAARAGHVLDRGVLLRESTALPCAVDSLDELLFAVRADTRLKLDPAMGFDFYATDLVLRAQAEGWQAAAVDAYLEHWSDTPAGDPIPASLAERVIRNGRAFEQKWSHRFPLETSWLAINAPGDVERFVKALPKC